MITRRDVDAGRVAVKTIGNGVLVPPGLQVNGLTLAEHQRRLAVAGVSALTQEEIARIHPDEYVEPSAQVLRDTSDSHILAIGDRS